MITVQVHGLDDIRAKLGKFTGDLEDTIQAAGKEAAERVILPTEGLQAYPPETAANLPPTPFYIRGRGMQRGGVRIEEYNDMSSEKLGERWEVERAGPYSVKIGNTATKYAAFVHGREQSAFMAVIGWKMLHQVAEDKLGDITEVYEAWIQRLLRSLDLS